MDKEQVLEYLNSDEGKSILNEVNAGLLAKRDELLSKQVSMKGELERYRSLGDPDTLSTVVTEYSSLKQKKEEPAPQPVVDPKIVAERDHFKTELEKGMEKLSKIQNRLRTSAIDSTVMGAISKHDGIPELLKPLIQSQLKTELDDEGQVQITVINPDGSPKFKNGKEATVDDLISELRSNEVFQGAFKTKVASGSGTRATNGKRTETLDPSSPNFNLSEYMKSNKK